MPSPVRQTYTLRYTYISCQLSLSLEIRTKNTYTDTYICRLYSLYSHFALYQQHPVSFTSKRSPELRFLTDFEGELCLFVNDFETKWILHWNVLLCDSNGSMKPSAKVPQICLSNANKLGTTIVAMIWLSCCMYHAHILFVLCV